MDLVKTELKHKIEHQATVTQKKVNDQFAEVSEQIAEIKSNADLVKTTLENKIDQLVEVEQEKVQNQLTTMSAKLNEIDNRKEPVIAFRATVVKDSGNSQTQRLSKNPGKITLLLSSGHLSKSYRCNRVLVSKGHQNIGEWTESPVHK